MAPQFTATNGASAREEPAWERFSREFEERLNHVEADCTEGREGWNPAVQEAVVAIADALQEMRAHYARCGQEGETTRTGLVQRIAAAKAALKP